MGRGRAKAKQTKVARDLKYGVPGMDLDRLRADLGQGPVPSQGSATDEDSDSESDLDDDED